ncbi:sensor domain-containing protein [Aureibacillus halotolerans]|uniref:PAS domain S-box-containing protein/diguanylate cyclase (GGDEF)-like protein n=1 Tax=Aureibacillus halotolerans TaxID=1508390 RepID=A0A4V3D5K3_9BACI|nr:bifunctional diguanylate cyclase/phosphodiesterase [Aureibacillus halotolerans]TDQ40317.1 PAS domain S-box-containing protein/diguanylate cyclase (GGDEF)-like protein [Aureibacillus halotolerans]
MTNEEYIVLQDILDSVLFQKTNQGMMITTLQGEILAVNRLFEALTGYREEEIIGKKAAIFKTEKNHNFWKQVKETGSWDGKLISYKKNGTSYEKGLSIRTIYTQKEKPLYYIGMFSDVTKESRAEKRLHLQAKVIEQTVEGVMITDHKLRILSINPAFTRVTGYTENEVLGKTPRFLQSGKQEKWFYERMCQSLKENGEWQGEVWNKSKNGTIYPEWLSVSVVTDENGKPTHYVSIYSDISHRKQAEDRLYKLAHYDMLTDLPNRRTFENRLSQAIQLASQEKTRVALVFIDLDRFKQINDTFGHAAGDELLRQVGQRMEKTVRPDDVVSRWGGDEFTIILENYDHLHQITAMAEAIHSSMSEPFHIQGGETLVTPSIGISVYPEDGQDTEMLLKKADTAMYMAKKEKNTYKYFTQEMQSLDAQLSDTRQRIRTAMENNEFFLMYQPQIALATGKLSGLEALLRWNNEENGFISPAVFIPLAEETGQIVELGLWVIQTACEQIQEWSISTGLSYPVSINISALQLEEKDFVHKVKEIISMTGVDAAFLRFELTESIFIKDCSSTIQSLQHFKEMGIQLAVDDFGTGYSSLSYLKRLPVNELKIDQSFLRDVLIDGSNATIVTALIDIAHSLGIRVVAEGIELQDQESFLKKRNCDIGQGYLYSRPVLGVDVTNQWLKKENSRILSK